MGRATSTRQSASGSRSITYRLSLATCSSRRHSSVTTRSETPSASSSVPDLTSSLLTVTRSVRLVPPHQHASRSTFTPHTSPRLAGACKVIILGDSGVGKTSLLARVENGGFSTSMPATVGCSFCPHTIQLSNGRSVELHLWDTAGQERYRAFTRQYFRGSVAAIVAYDLTNWGSFTGAKSWIADLQNVREHLPSQR